MVFLKWSVQFWISMHNTSMAPKRSQSINLSFIIATSNGLNVIHWLKVPLSTMDCNSVPLYGMPNALFASFTLPNLQIPSTLLFPYFAILPSSLFLFANATLPNCRVHIAEAESSSCLPNCEVDVANSTSWMKCSIRYHKFWLLVWCLGSVVACCLTFFFTISP